MVRKSATGDHGAVMGSKSFKAIAGNGTCHTKTTHAKTQRFCNTISDYAFAAFLPAIRPKIIAFPNAVPVI